MSAKSRGLLREADGAPHVLDAVGEAAHAQARALERERPLEPRLASRVPAIAQGQPRRSAAAQAGATGGRARAGRRRPRTVSASGPFAHEVGAVPPSTRSVPSPENCRSREAQRPLPRAMTQGLAVADRVLRELHLHVLEARPGAREPGEVAGRVPGASPLPWPRGRGPSGTAAGASTRRKGSRLVSRPAQRQRAS